MIAIISLLAGAALGFVFPYYISGEYTTYLAVAILAGLDTAVGGIRANLKGVFDFKIFSTGFLFNTLLAAGLTYLGDILGVDIYIAAVVVFGTRLFQNVAEIRRIISKTGKERDDRQKTQ